MASHATKWAPAGIVAIVIAAATVAIPLQASAVELPPLTAEEVLSLMDRDIEGFSGTVVKTTELGLPPLEMSQMMTDEMVAEMQETMPEGFEDFVPQLIDGSAITDAIAFIAGEDRVRVYASEQGFRAQILDPLSQRDIVVTETEVWSYDARTQTATTATFDATISEADLEQAVASLEVDISNPDALAAYIMEQVGDDTTVSVGDHQLVAGRGAYTLIVEPTSAVSLVDFVEVAIDADTGLGLAATLFATEQEEPALRVAFESVTFEAPDASLFSFEPPAGTTVEVVEVPAALTDALADFDGNEPTDAEKEALASELSTAFGEPVNPVVTGERWDTVVSASSLPESIPLEMFTTELFADLVVTVEGGIVFSTPLMNVLIVDSGEVFAGAVTIEHLQSVAAR